VRSVYYTKKNRQGYVPPDVNNDMGTLASAYYKSKYGGLLRYKHIEGPKRLQLLIDTLRAIPDLRVLHSDKYSGDINDSNTMSSSTNINTANVIKAWLHLINDLSEDYHDQWTCDES
jgi:hypothetical protein